MKTKKRLFGLLLGLVLVLGLLPGMSLTAFAADITVTWNKSDINDNSRTSFTKDGVTVNCDRISAYGDDVSIMNLSESTGTFTTTLGNFTKIEVTAMHNVSGTGWSGSGMNATWTGEASSSVPFSGSIMGYQGLTIVFTIAPAKQAQTITASDVTVTYGDTDKSVSATTDGDGAISYAVKDGSADYIDVDATTGALTIKKVGTATVIVTAAETATYAQATKEVIVTVNKADSTAAAVTANNRTYDGTEKPLVAVTGTPTGGTMQYALGTDATTAPTTGYTTSIPTGTNAGTYHVWYKVVGDENHNDGEAACVTATIAAAPQPDPAPARVAKPSSEGHPAAGTLDVSWKAADGAKAYEVQWRKRGGKWQTKATKSRKLTVSGLKKGTPYEVRVRAKAGSKAGEWSPVVRRWLRGPSSVRAKSGSKSGSVKVSWKRDAKATGGTKVYVYARKGGKLVKTATAEAGKTSVTVDGLKAGKRYFVRVRPARKASGKAYAGTLSSYRSVRAAK